MKPADQPGSKVMDIVGGPPGSGKSTFFRVADRRRDSFNIDERRKALNQGSSQRFDSDVRRRAIADYEAFIQDHIKDEIGFSFEATLAKDVTFEQAARAKRSGFQVHLTYVGAEPDECVERVTRRVLRGGHGAPATLLRETHAASLRNLPRALQAFDVVQVFDNSVPARLDETLHEAMPRLVLEVQRGVVTYTSTDPPSWLRTALADTEYALT